jgi:hypothetical protein
MVLENELRMRDEKIHTDKQAFSQELGSISSEMTKLRNIQALYLKEKEMNEHLEHQINKINDDRKEERHAAQYGSN